MGFSWLFSERSKNQVRDRTEECINRLHHIADKLPLAPLDGAVHGIARGIFNWLLDLHPDQGKKIPECKKIIIPSGNFSGKTDGINCINFLNWFAEQIRKDMSKFKRNEQTELIDLLTKLRQQKFVSPDDLLETYNKLKIDIHIAVFQTNDLIEKRLDDLRLDVQSILIKQDKALNILAEVNKKVDHIEEQLNDLLHGECSAPGPPSASKSNVQEPKKKKSIR